MASSSDRPLGVAIAGLGFGEKVHLPALRDCPTTEPVALWHPRTDRLAQACQAAALPGTTDFGDLLADPRVEAVVIATPPAPRFDLARQALQAGKHLLLEKPVALHTTEIEELQRLAMRQKCCVAVDFEYRAVPVFQQLAALIAEGVLGEPWLVKLDWLMASRADASRPWSWYSQAAAGGGVLGALGTHAFDMLHGLVGPSRRLQASLSTAIPERPLGQGGPMATVDAEDIALVQLQLEDGWGRRVPAQLSLASVARHGRGCWLELHGSEATFVLGSPNQADYVHGFRLWRGQPGDPGLTELAPDPALAFPRTWSDGRIAPVRRLIDWWAAAIGAGRPMVPGLAEAVASQRCCDAARASDGGQLVL
jgi:predicted dehydrogenase